MLEYRVLITLVQCLVCACARSMKFVGEPLVRGERAWPKGLELSIEEKVLGLGVQHSGGRRKNAIEFTASEGPTVHEDAAFVSWIATL